MKLVSHRFPGPAILLAALLFMVGGCSTNSSDPASPSGTKAMPSAASMPAPPSSYQPWDDTARFLAGMPGAAGSPLNRWRSTAWWRQHREQMDWLWMQHTLKRGNAVKAWRGDVLGSLDGRHYVFYPFSGPDFLFADAFFPRASHYLLCGLEPCGSIPDLRTLSEEELKAGVENLQVTLDTILQHSFFITKDMRRDLARTRLKGTVPVFLALLARTGHTVELARPVGLDAAGRVSTVPGGPGHHFAARSASGQKKHLFYFRQNLADGRGLSRFLSFGNTMGHPVTFLKSTSYLMHGGGFSQIRNHILKHSAAVVQTPSGIPFRHYSRDRWNLELYGNYVRTLDIFAEYYQPDLAAAYRESSHRVTPINFGLGYVFEQGASSLLVAKRKAIEF